MINIEVMKHREEWGGVEEGNWRRQSLGSGGEVASARRKRG